MIGPGQVGKEYGIPDSLKLILNLLITYDNGTSDTVSTDSTWRATASGPLVPGEP